MLGKTDEAHERAEKPDQQSEHRYNQEHCSDSLPALLAVPQSVDPDHVVTLRSSHALIWINVSGIMGWGRAPLQQQPAGDRLQDTLIQNDPVPSGSGDGIPPPDDN
jgi:hypothetical protein